MTEEEVMMEEEELLVPLDDYLSNGIHVGLKYKTSDMREFIYKIRPDKLCVFDVRKIDDRIKVAAEFISRYNPEDILLVSNRMYGRKCIKKFAEYTGAKVITKRFVSGTLTNPNIETFIEPELIIITDPTVDQQAIKEASIAGITVVAICDTNSRLKNIDLVIPSNNKGKNSLALIYWILTREILKNRGEKFNTPLEEFISQAEPQPYLLEVKERQRLKRLRRRRSGRRR
ncbi:MAG: 30S ribosomal protein S2 [Candidatus Altiarchaeota archaeon]|nr:30S ribosomal protein S2 [Candidatus Altiarchaeota archaeon]